MLVRSRSSSVIVTLFCGYASFGTFWGVWVVVFGDFLARHRLSEGGASLFLAALSITSIATMTVVAPSLVKLPRRVSVALALAFNGVAVLLLGVAPRGWLLAAFALTGVGTGLIDVFMSLAGQQLEVSEGKPVLQWVHVGLQRRGGGGRPGGRFPVAVGFRAVACDRCECGFPSHSCRCKSLHQRVAGNPGAAGSCSPGVAVRVCGRTRAAVAERGAAGRLLHRGEHGCVVGALSPGARWEPR